MQIFTLESLLNVLLAFPTWGVSELAGTINTFSWALDLFMLICTKSRMLVKEKWQANTVFD